MKGELFDKGYLKLSKNILEWQWYTDANVSRLFVHILLKANFKQHSWQGHEIKKGEFITSVDKLHVDLNLSIQAIRTALQKLERTKYIITKPTNKFTLIKLLESEVFSVQHYERNNLYGSPPENALQTNNGQQTTTNNEIKEIDFEKRIDIFKNEIFKFSSKYSKDVLLDFFNFYSQKNSQTGRAKFEEDKYWNLTKKLATWKDFPKTENKKTFTKNR